MSIYARQMEALNKHRGKGHQKVAVKYVHVDTGGQAVIGNVEAGSKRAGPPDRTKGAPTSIMHTPAEPFDIGRRARGPAKQPKKVGRRR